MDPIEYEPAPLFAEEGVPGGVDADFDDSRDFTTPTNPFEID